jgi:hypothetical protein
MLFTNPHPNNIVIPACFLAGISFLCSSALSSGGLNALYKPAPQQHCHPGGFLAGIQLLITHYLLLTIFILNIFCKIRFIGTLGRRHVTVYWHSSFSFALFFQLPRVLRFLHPLCRIARRKNDLILNKNKTISRGSFSIATSFTRG